MSGAPHRNLAASAAGLAALLLAAACSPSASTTTHAAASASTPAPTGAAAAAASGATSANPPGSAPPSQTPHTATTSSRPGAAAGLGGCPVASADSIWRTHVDRLPVFPRSAAYVASIGGAKHVHADFGSGVWDGGPIGIPVTVIPPGTPSVRVAFDYAGESDKGPYPIPAGALVEGGPQSTGDRHVIAVDPGTCSDYELYDAHRNSDGSWHAGSGAVFNLRSDALRPAGWTSADAAGLPVLPGLARFDEAGTGTIDHALRITVPRTQNTFVWPARHQASSSTDPALPPMGLRLRLKASVDISRLPLQARAVAQALKTYGAIIADNGSSWYISGTPDDRWNNDQLQSLSVLTGGDFEAVDTSGLQVSPNSAAARVP